MVERLILRQELSVLSLFKRLFLVISTGYFPMKQTKPLSKIDRKILRELQNDGRMSYAELARRVGLTTTPCMERVRRMERDGVIQGYSAVLNPAHLEAGLVVFVQIRLSRKSPDIFAEFTEAASGPGLRARVPPRVRQFRLFNQGARCQHGRLP